MRTYDVKCNECESEEEQLLGDKEDFQPCSQCGGEVRRIFTKMCFKLIDDPKSQMCGGAHNQYNHNRYYDDFKKARYEEGRDVRPLGEDP